MVASTDIKFFVHTNSNAPQLQNAYGSMINVLDACLIDGINIGPVSSLTASGTIVTALFGAAHNLLQYQVIKITGADQDAFNGEHRILTVPNAQSVTFELVAVPSTTTATGTISASLPPLGWEKPFSSVNGGGGGKAAYRSTNLLLPSRPFLRVVDERDVVWGENYAKYAKVGIVEDMTSINTMLGGQAPFDGSAPDKNWIGTGAGQSAINGWAKWYYAKLAPAGSPSYDYSTPSSGSRGWILVGSGDYFYILPALVASNDNALSYGFGSFESLLNVDNSNTFLSATFRYHSASNIDHESAFTGICGAGANQKIILLRDYSQENYAEAHPLSIGRSVIYSGSADYIGGHSINNMIYFSPVYISETVFRGVLNGIYWLLQTRPYSKYHVFEKNDFYYIAVPVTSTTNSGVLGQIVLKIGGANAA